MRTLIFFNIHRQRASQKHRISRIQVRMGVTGVIQASLDPSCRVEQIPLTLSRLEGLNHPHGITLAMFIFSLDLPSHLLSVHP